MGLPMATECFITSKRVSQEGGRITCLFNFCKEGGILITDGGPSVLKIMNFEFNCYSKFKHLKNKANIFLENETN